MKQETISKEVLAAITMALHECQGYTSHVSESGTLTLENNHSEWSSKLFGQRIMPEHKF